MLRFAASILALTWTPVLFAQTVTVTQIEQISIPDDAYIGIADGNDGTGIDAGMACFDLDFSSEDDLAVTGGRLTVYLEHSYLGDVTIKIQSPAGLVLPVLVRAQGDAPTDLPTDDGEGSGGDSSQLTASLPLTFFDGAPNDAETMGAGLGGQGTVCGNDNRCEFAPNPSAAAGQPGTIGTFAGFAGEPSRGIWEVCFGDADPAAEGTVLGASLSLSGSPVSVEEDPSGEFALGLVGANPFTGTTTLGLRTATTQRVRATLHDALGREVAQLHEGAALAETELRLVVEAATLPAGTYLVRVVGETFAATQSVTVGR